MTAVPLRAETAAPPARYMGVPLTHALSTLKVVEFGRFISAAFCCKLLAGYGAEVIKIEPPGVGDEAREHGPFPRGEPDSEQSGLFLNLNVNKLGVTLDPRTPSGRRLFMDILENSDILATNFRQSELEEWGLDDGTVRRTFPGLITTSVTVFGDEGPKHDHHGHAITAAAAGGLAGRIGDPARSPLTTMMDRSDYWGGMIAAGATMMAVMARESTGQGQHVDISSAEVLGNFVNSTDIFAALEGERWNARAGRRILSPYPWVFMPVKDGHFAMITAQERHWWRFVELMGDPDWSKEPRYRDRIAMGSEYPDEVDALVEPFVAEHTKWEIWEKCRERDIPFQAVQTMSDILKNDHLQERGFWGSIRDPEEGEWTYPGGPFKMTRTPWALRMPAPRLGQHNHEVFGDRLGLPRTELVDLYRAGVV